MNLSLCQSNESISYLVILQLRLKNLRWSSAQSAPEEDHQCNFQISVWKRQGTIAGGDCEEGTGVGLQLQNNTCDMAHQQKNDKWWTNETPIQSVYCTFFSFGTWHAQRLLKLQCTSRRSLDVEVRNLEDSLLPISLWQKDALTEASIDPCHPMPTKSAGSVAPLHSAFSSPESVTAHAVPFGCLEADKKKRSAPNSDCSSKLMDAIKHIPVDALIKGLHIYIIIHTHIYDILVYWEIVVTDNTNTHQPTSIVG